MNFNGTSKSYQACSIILLKIDFESIINLGGENTHLDSKPGTHLRAVGSTSGVWKTPILDPWLVGCSTRPPNRTHLQVQPKLQLSDHQLSTDYTSKSLTHP